jgi:hypothetical protein
MRPARRLGGLRHLLPVALCALAGHLALYGSLAPSRGDHAYFFWYEPLVAGLSVVALTTLAGLLLVATVGSESLRQSAVSLLPAPRSVPGTVRAVRLALASLAFLACQETLERTLGEGRLAPAAFGTSQILLVVAVVAVAAAVVALVERSCSRLIDLVVGGAFGLRRPSNASFFPPMRPQAVRRRHPLAQLRGLRAPPLSA